MALKPSGESPHHWETHLVHVAFIGRARQLQERERNHTLARPEATTIEGPQVSSNAPLPPVSRLAQSIHDWRVRSRPSAVFKLATALNPPWCPRPQSWFREKAPRRNDMRAYTDVKHDIGSGQVFGCECIVRGGGLNGRAAGANTMAGSPIAVRDWIFRRIYILTCGR